MDVASTEIISYLEFQLKHSGYGEDDMSYLVLGLV